jgi:hypothetical protein
VQTQTIVSVRTIEVNRRKYAFHSDAAELRRSQCGPCADHQNSCHQQRSVQLNEAGRARSADRVEHHPGCAGHRPSGRRCSSQSARSQPVIGTGESLRLGAVGEHDPRLRTAAAVLSGSQPLGDLDEREATPLAGSVPPSSGLPRGRGHQAAFAVVTAQPRLGTIGMRSIESFDFEPP